MHVSGPKSKKDLNYELNLVPFLDLLSVCIYFLLLTAIWVQIGSMNVKQAVGPSSDPGKPRPSINVQLEQNGSLIVSVKEAPQGFARNLTRIVLDGKEGKIDFDKLEQYLGAVRTVAPEMDMAIISPNAKSVYDDLITMMDRFRGQGFVDLGVSPL